MSITPSIPPQVDHLTPFVKYLESQRTKGALFHLLMDGIIRGRIKSHKDVTSSDFEILEKFLYMEKMGMDHIRRMSANNVRRIVSANPNVLSQWISVIKKIENVLGIKLRGNNPFPSSLPPAAGTPQGTGLPSSLYVNPPWSPFYRPPRNPMNDPIPRPEPVVPGYRDIYGPKAPPPYLGIDSSEWARSDFNDPDGLFFDLSSAFQAKDLEKGEDSSGSPDENGEPGEGVEGDNFGDVDYLSFNLYISEDGTRTYEYFVNGKPVSKEKYKEAEKKIKPSSNERPLESGTSEGDFSASTRWLFGVDPNLGADRHLIPTHQGAEPDTLPDAAHHPWEDPFSGWRMPGGFDRFTQQSRPMGPGDLSGMPDEEHASFGAYVAGVRAGERILTYDFGGGLEASQKEAAVRGMTRNPRMNTGGVKQRADGSIAKWNPKLPDDL